MEFVAFRQELLPELERAEADICKNMLDLKQGSWYKKLNHKRI